MHLGWLNCRSTTTRCSCSWAWSPRCSQSIGCIAAKGECCHVWKRVSLVALRLLTLAGVLAMLLEPAIIFTKREMIPSRLLVLVDNSESLDFNDAYVDGRQAKRIVDSLGLKSIDELRGESRLKLAERAQQRPDVAIGGKGRSHCHAARFLRAVVRTASGQKTGNRPFARSIALPSDGRSSAPPESARR